MRNVLTFIPILALTFCCACATTAPFSPVRIFPGEISKGKIYSLEYSLEIRNPEEFPVWFVIASSGNELLRYDGEFGALVDIEDSHRSPYRVNALGFEPKRIMEFCSSGDEMFSAVKVPAYGHILIKERRLGHAQRARFLDIWLSKEILVNGKYPLEQFLGLDMTAPRNAVAIYRGDCEEIKDFPKGMKIKATHFQVNPIRRLLIPIEISIPNT